MTDDQDEPVEITAMSELALMQARADASSEEK